MMEELTAEEVLDITAKNAERKGKEKGREEGKLEVAKSMLDNGIGVEDVIKITKLSREAVLSLTK